jgi:hypothetical protein
MTEHADDKAVQLRQAPGEEPQYDALAAARLAADEREAALAHQGILDAPAEAVDFFTDKQRFGWQFGREGIPFEAVERKQLHDGSSSSGR